MNKLTKIFLITSAVLAGLGLILLIIGRVGGGNIGNALDLMEDSDIIHMDINHDTDEDNSHVATTGKNEETEFFTSDFDNISISVGAMHTVFRASDDANLHIINESDQNVKAYIMGDKLKIESDNKVSVSTDDGVIYIDLPGGMILDTVDMSYDAAYIESEDELDIYCDKFVIDLGAGDVGLGGITSDEIEVNVGAGNVELTNTRAEDLDVSVGMGGFTLKGDVTGDLDADCSMGNIDLLIDSPKEDHNIRYKVSAGNFSVDNNDYSGIGNGDVIDNDADSDYNFDCSMGNISVKFVSIL